MVNIWEVITDGYLRPELAIAYLFGKSLRETQKKQIDFGYPPPGTIRRAMPQDEVIEQGHSLGHDKSEQAKGSEST
jgi:hypothetical protein